MRKYVHLFLLLLMCGALTAQTKIGYHSERDFGNRAYVEGTYGLAANGLSNAFLFRILGSNHLDRGFLEEQESRMETLNVFGYMAESRLGAHYNPHFLNLTLGLTVRQNNLEAVRYTRDAYHLMFFGNKDFAGLNASLDGLRYRRFNYTSLDFDVHFHSRDMRHHFSLTPALHYGATYLQMNVDEASLYTEADGSAIRLTGDYELLRNGSKPGWGGSFGIRYRYISGPHYFDFKVKDAGRLYWKEMSYTQMDSVVTFSGFTVDNLFQTKDAFQEIQLQDTMNAILEGSQQKGTLSVWLPIQLYMEYIYKLPWEGWDVGLRFHHRFMSAYAPEWRLDAYYHIDDKWDVSGIAAYGGYGGLRIGASGRYLLHPAMSLCIETQYLSSMILSGRSTGLGGFVKFNYQF